MRNSTSIKRIMIFIVQLHDPIYNTHNNAYDNNFCFLFLPPNK